MSSSITKFKKFFKRTKNKRDKSGSLVECDSVPVHAVQDNLPSPIPIPHEPHNTRRGLDVANPENQHHLTPNSATDGISQNLNSFTNSYHSSYSGHSYATPHIQLSVSNSHGFHIGDVQNVHVSNGSVVNINPGNSAGGLNSLEKSLGTLNKPYDDQTFESLVKDYTKIKDWELSLISEHVGQDWKSLGRRLEIEEYTLAAIEENESSPTESALEMLNFYVKTFPNTSYGYLLHTLRENGHHKAVNQLIKLRL